MKKRIDPGYLISLLLSVVLAFVIGAVILAIAGFSPGKAYLAMLNGAFSSARHIGDLLEYAMVLCLCGLACVLGARVGIFNVGGEGQLLLGAIVACQVGVWLDGLTPWLVLPLAALAAMAAGGLYALIPGVLKVKVKVNEVITTIMLNTVAASFCQYLAKGPWKNANKNMVAATEQLNARYWFGGLIGGSNLSTAILAAAVLALVIWYVMQKTSRGYEMKLTGQNERFARFIGIRTDRLVLVCMLLSGALPQDQELDTVLEKASYGLEKRSGFVSSENYADEQQKKNDLYLLKAGSCFETQFEGDIYDVGCGGSHPVYRYAKALFVGV